MTAITQFHSPNLIYRVDYSKELRDPHQIVNNLNKKISKLHLKSELVKTIVGITLTILAGGSGIGLCFLGSTQLICCGAALIIASPIAASKLVNRYREENRQYSDITKEIANLPAKEFWYLDNVTTDVGLSADDFNAIKNHIQHQMIASTGNHLEIRRFFLYRILAEKIFPWSIQPIALNLIRTQDAEEYRPWIHLLLAVEKSQLISPLQKSQIGKAIGFMIHKPYEKADAFKLKLDLFRARRIPLQLEPAFYYNAQESDDGIETYSIIKRQNNQEFTYSSAATFAQMLKSDYELEIPA